MVDVVEEEVVVVLAAVGEVGEEEILKLWTCAFMCICVNVFIFPSWGEEKSIFFFWIFGCFFLFNSNAKMILNLVDLCICVNVCDFFLYIYLCIEYVDV